MSLSLRSKVAAVGVVLALGLTWSVSASSDEKGEEPEVVTSVFAVTGMT